MTRFILLAHIIIFIASPWSFAQREEPERVEFFSQDGVSIRASYYSSRQRYSPAVLLLPEFRQSRAFWDRASAYLSDKGYAVLVIDFRGQGESTQLGERSLDWAFFPNTYFKLFLLDINASMNFLHFQPGVDQSRMAIMGAGLGANAALLFASGDKRIEGLILISPGLNYRGLEIEEAITKYGNRPILIIVSRDDCYSLYSSKRLYSLAKGRKELKIYPNAGRGAKMPKRRADIMEFISQWLKELFD